MSKKFKLLGVNAAKICPKVVTYFSYIQQLLGILLDIEVTTFIEKNSYA